MHPVTRRTTVGFGACAAIFRLLPICHLNAQTAVSDELYSRFLSWSRTATGFADIPAASARSFLALSLRSGITHDQLSALDPGSYRGTPIERRLLEAWYTGVFKIGSAETASYETTLTWRAAGIDPPPGTCRNGPDSWAAAPPNI